MDEFINISFVVSSYRKEPFFSRIQSEAIDQLISSASAYFDADFAV